MVRISEYPHAAGNKRPRDNVAEGRQSNFSPLKISPETLNFAEWLVRDGSDTKLDQEWEALTQEVCANSQKSNSALDVRKIARNTSTETLRAIYEAVGRELQRRSV